MHLRILDACIRGRFPVEQYTIGRGAYIGAIIGREVLAVTNAPKDVADMKRAEKECLDHERFHKGSLIWLVQ